MFADRIEGKWIDSFARVFELCKIDAGETVVAEGVWQREPA